MSNAYGPDGLTQRDSYIIVFAIGEINILLLLRI